MKAIVVYESLWGNTAAIARAIAEGIGPEAQALSTAEAAGNVIADADLIVAGAPLVGFSLPTESIRNSIRANPGNPPAPPDLTNPSMRSWLDALAQGHGRSAAFETRIWWSPGSAVKTIQRRLEEAGYARLAEPQRFMVTGRFGPLKEGEIERAKLWGVKLAKTFPDSRTPIPGS